MTQENNSTINSEIERENKIYKTVISGIEHHLSYYDYQKQEDIFVSQGRNFKHAVNSFLTDDVLLDPVKLLSAFRQISILVQSWDSSAKLLEIIFATTFNLNCCKEQMSNLGHLALKPKIDSS